MLVLCPDPTHTVTQVPILGLAAEIVEQCLLKCDPLRENLVLRANIELELEAILSMQVVSQLNSDYCTNVSQGACTVSC